MSKSGFKMCYKDRKDPVPDSLHGKDTSLIDGLMPCFASGRQLSGILIVFVKCMRCQPSSNSDPGVVVMISKKAIFSVSFIGIFVLLLFNSAPAARESGAPFPTFGTGSLEVRLYTDYFCPPCRALEPEVEPVLKSLLKKKAIRLTLVDVPYNQNSPLYARYFLYSLAKSRDVEHAIHVRNILFASAAKKDANGKEQIEALLKSKGIAYEALDTKTAFSRYNALIQEDRIDATPTCVILRGDKREKYVGRPDIVSALKKLQ